MILECHAPTNNVEEIVEVGMSPFHSHVADYIVFRAIIVVGGEYSVSWRMGIFSFSLSRRWLASSTFKWWCLRFLKWGSVCDIGVSGGTWLSDVSISSSGFRSSSWSMKARGFILFNWKISIACRGCGVRIKYWLTRCWSRGARTTCRYFTN